MQLRRHPATATRWAQRPPVAPSKAAQSTGEIDDQRFAGPDWMWVGDRRMFVVGYTSGGAPFGCNEDEFDNEP
jgi:hypothetical protein